MTRSTFLLAPLLGAVLAATLVVPAAAQVAPARPVAAPPAPATGTRPRSILFIGNSFTQGANSAVKRYRNNSVTDLNGDGYGGVAALFKLFTQESGLNYAVALETDGGKTLGFHWNQRRLVVDRQWDVVVLQELSTLDHKQGDPTDFRTYAPQFAAMFQRNNPKVDVYLMATWSRADLTYQPGSPWSGKPIAAMAEDLRKATDGVRALSPAFRGVLPVGEAWLRAMAAGVADPNPYDGVAFGQVDLWTYDHYHASIFGYYLEALVTFGRITGVDPTRLGANERAADDLGIDPKVAVQLQQVAKAQLALP